MTIAGWGLIEFIAIALLIPGVVFALYLGALLIWANDIVHQHCADPERDWE